MIWFVRGGKVESSCFYLHAIYFAMVSPIFPLGLMGFSPGQNPNTIFIITHFIYCKNLSITSLV